MTIRKNEYETLIENLKNGFKELIQNRAEEMAESDDDALADIREQESRNSDCGGCWEYNDIDGSITDRLEEDAEAELFETLADELGEKSMLFKTLLYIHESSIDDSFICHRCEHEFYVSEENNDTYCKKCQPHAGV